MNKLNDRATRAQGVLILAALMAFAATTTSYGIDQRLTSALDRGDGATVKLLASYGDGSRDSARDLALGYASLITADYHAARSAFTSVADAVRPNTGRLPGTAESLTSQNPDSWSAHLLQGDLLARAGRCNEALATLNRAIELNGRAAAAYHVRGLIHALAGNESLAAADLTRAIQIDQDFADAYAARAVLRIRQGRFSEAQRDAEQALHIAPDFPVALNVRGVALCRRGNYEDALCAFTFALDLEPDFAVAKHNQQAAKLLAAEGRAKVLIDKQTDRRKGAIGIRTLAVVAAEQDRATEATLMGSGVLQAATGVRPAVVTTPEKAIELLTVAEQPVVLAVPVSDKQDSANVMRGVLKQVSQSVPKTDVRILSDGRTANLAVAAALKPDPADNAGTPPVRSWDATVSDDEDPAGLARVALPLRASGVPVRAYGRDKQVAAWQGLPPAEKKALHFYGVPEFPEEESTPKNPSVLPAIAPQISASLAAPPEKQRGGQVQASLSATPSGMVGVYVASMNLPNFQPGEMGIPVGSIWAGASRHNNLQVFLGSGSQTDRIRFDIGENPPGQPPHINVNGHHSHKKGVVIKEGDRVEVTVRGRTAEIKVNGVPRATYGDLKTGSAKELVIRKLPNSSKYEVIVGGKRIAVFIRNGNKSADIIAKGDNANQDTKVHVLPPPPAPKGAQGEAADGKSTSGKSQGGNTKPSTGKNDVKASTLQPGKFGGRPLMPEGSGAVQVPQLLPPMPPLAWTLVPSSDGFSFVAVLDWRRWQFVPVLTPEAEEQLRRESERARGFAGLSKQIADTAQQPDPTVVPHPELNGPWIEVYPMPPRVPNTPHPPHPIDLHIPGVNRPGKDIYPPPRPPFPKRLLPTGNSSDSTPGKGGGVALGGGQGSEVIDGRTAGLSRLLGKKREPVRIADVRTSLKCPFLIFPAGPTKE